MKPEDDPADPAFYRIGQTGVEPALPPKPEMTFKSELGSPVFTFTWKRIAQADLFVRIKVLVPSLFGYCEATVIDVSSVSAEGLAESPDLLFPLYVKGGDWWCASTISKNGLP